MSTLQADFVSHLIASAEQHAEDDEPDHIIGDLQQHLAIMWGMLNPVQRLAFVSHAQVYEVLQSGLFDSVESILEPIKQELSLATGLQKSSDVWQSLFEDFPEDATEGELSMSDLAPWLRDHIVNLRCLLGIQDQLAYVVVQEGGSSIERYVHSFDTVKQAEEFRVSCHLSGSYRTSGLYELPVALEDSPPFDGFIDLLYDDVDDFDYPSKEESAAIIMEMPRESLNEIADNLDVPKKYIASYEDNQLRLAIIDELN